MPQDSSDFSPPLATIPAPTLVEYIDLEIYSMLNRERLAHSKNA